MPRKPPVPNASAPKPPAPTPTTFGPLTAPIISGIPIDEKGWLELWAENPNAANQAIIRLATRLHDLSPQIAGALFAASGVRDADPEQVRRYACKLLGSAEKRKS